ncbi:MAG: restriction endonuclease subunit S [Pseudobutyrivibrio sp.]|nr:restriction endonuclease subunit S [Pseudobutyrivibrio sp.]
MREMRDSGIEWIGSIPNEWKIKRIKELFYEVNERSEKNDDYQLLSVSENYGVAPKAEKVDEGDFLTHADSLEGYKICKPDDIVMNIMLAWKRALGVSRYEGIISPAYCIYRKRTNEIDTGYYHYLYRTDLYAGLFKQYSTGIIDSRLRLYPNKFLSLKCQMPELKEQKRMVEYLDSKCAQIDSIIAKQGQIIEKLKEYKLSVITEAVTKGLNPDAEMKDSGIKWIKKIPSSWTVTSLSNGISLVQTGPFGSQLHSEDYIENGDLYLINPANIVNGQIVPDCNVSISLEKAYELKQHILEVGDIVFGRRGEMGRCACVEDDGNRYFCGTGCIKLKCNERLDAHFLTLYLQTSYIRQYLELNSVGTTMANLNSSIISKIPIVYPIIEEQKEIAKYISEKCEQIDKKIYLQETMIRKEMQYKQSIIYEVITGKREV